MKPIKRTKNSKGRFIIKTGLLVSYVTMLTSLYIYIRPCSPDMAAADLKNICAYAAGLPAAVGKIKSRWKKDHASVSAASDSAHRPFSHSTSAPYLNSSPTSPSSLAEEAAGIGEGTYTAMLDTSMGPMMYYNQRDRRWANYLYGGRDPISSYGCGPTAVAMIINSFSPSRVTPPKAADWAAANGCYTPGGGSLHNLIAASLQTFGFRVESVKDRTPDTVIRLLKSRHIVIALMGKGALTDNGHFILITKSLDDGNVSIADPNSYDNCRKEWDLRQLLSELKKCYDNGAPLWAVSASDG